MTNGRLIPTRIRHFLSNAGWFNSVKAVTIAAFAAYWLSAAGEDDDRLELLLLLAFGLAAPYWFRQELMGHLSLVRGGLDFAVALTILFTAKMGHPYVNRPVLRLCLVTAMALYLGCYFWLLSDPRVELKNREE